MTEGEREKPIGIQTPPTEEASRHIPEAIKRQLRQEAGFGCCVCGFPFFQYHHIIPYAGARQHDPDHIMLLCPNHHQQAEAGALSEEEQRRWKAAPTNIDRGYAQGQLFLPDPVLVVRGGEWAIVGPFQFVVEDEMILEIRLDDEQKMLITLNLYDREDNLLLSIVDNEWITGDPAPWDLESNYRWLRMRAGHREATLRIDATKEHVRLHCVIRRKGYGIELTNGRLSVSRPDGSRALTDMRVIVGLKLIINPSVDPLRTDSSAEEYFRGPLPGGAKVLSGPNLEELIAEALQFYRENV